MTCWKVMEEWDACLAEAAVSFMPRQLHSLFVTILIFGQPTKPGILWDKYKDVMGEDILRNLPVHHCMSTAEKQTCVANEVLFFLQEKLEGMGLRS